MKVAVPTKESSLCGNSTPVPLLLPTLSLRSNFGWTLIGNLTYAISQWGIIIVLTKTSSPELVGRYALALAVTGPLITLACLQLRSVQATDAAGEFRFGDYLALRILMMLAVLAVIGVVASVGGFRWEVATVIFALGMARCIEAISEIFIGLFQQHERMDLVAQSTILKGILSLPGFMAGYYVTQSLLGGVAGLGVAWILVLLLFDLPQGRKLASPGKVVSSLRNPRALVRLIWMALPLGIGAVLATLEINIPRYFIEHQFGEHQLGVFAAMVYLTAIPTQAINALGQAASPKLARLHASGQRSQFLRLLSILVGCGLLIGTGGFLFVLVGGRAIVQLFYTADYAQHNHLLVWLMAAAGITYGYIFLGTALNALRIFRPRVPIHLLTSSILLLTCYFLGSKWGMMGVVWAICATQILTACCYLSVVTYCLWRTVEIPQFSTKAPC